MGGGNAIGGLGFIDTETYKNIEKFHKNNGIILFLHDMLYSKDLINLKKLSPSFIGDESSYLGFNMAYLSESCQGDDILKYPFEVTKEKSFPVSHTHTCAAFDQKYIVINGPNKECLYSEFLEDKIANLEIGHTLSINEHEKKLIYNIICRLYNRCI